MLKNFTFMFVEDDSNTQEQMKIILQDEVKTFYQAEDGEKGLRCYRDKKPDIILTDINMPVMSGLEMAQTIKQEDPRQPIVVMSAFDDREILLDAVNIGIDGFIVKPIEMTQLIHKLEEIATHLQNRIDAENARLKALVQRQKEEMHGLYNLAHYDVLTGIPNRYLFNEKIDQTISRSQESGESFALFFIDLDDFKRINDTYGHKAGDHILVHAVNSINAMIRKEDTLARIGGDEFALIVKNTTDRESLSALAKKIIHAVATPILIDGKTISISCSIGIGRYPHDATCKEELIHFADLAMYKIKSMEKSHFGFYGDD